MICVNIKRQAPKDLPLVVLLGSVLGFLNYSDILFLVTRRMMAARTSTPPTTM